MELTHGFYDIYKISLTTLLCPMWNSDIICLSMLGLPLLSRLSFLKVIGFAAGPSVSSLLRGFSLLLSNKTPNERVVLTLFH